jgi:hypothetical protein
MDIVNLVLTLLDPTGIGVVITPDIIDDYANATSTALVEHLKKNDKNLNYFEEEVFYNPTDALFMLDENDALVIDPVYVGELMAFQNDFMKNYGHDSNWRDNITAEQLELASAYGVVSANTQMLMDAKVGLENAYYKQPKTPPPMEPPKYPSWILVLFITLGLVVFGILIYTII